MKFNLNVCFCLSNNYLPNKHGENKSMKELYVIVITQSRCNNYIGQEQIHTALFTLISQHLIYGNYSSHYLQHNKLCGNPLNKQLHIFMDVSIIAMKILINKSNSSMRSECLRGLSLQLPFTNKDCKMLEWHIFDTGKHVDTGWVSFLHILYIVFEWRWRNN